MGNRIVILAAAFALAATPLAAQRVDYEQRANDLAALSGIFGELHHIRRLCEPRSEAEVWRARMRNLVALEQPQPAVRDRMVERFNSGFRDAEARFAYCDRDARDFAATAADEGDLIVARLMAPLYGAQGEGPSPP